MLLCVCCRIDRKICKRRRKRSFILFFLFDDAYLCIHFFFFSYEDDFYFLYTHTIVSLSLSLFGLSRLIKSHIRRRGYTAGAERWRHRTDHPESAPAFKKEDKKKLWFWKIFWFRRAHRLFIHFFSTNSHYYFRQTHRETDRELSDGAFFFILVAEIEKSWNRKEITIWSQFFMLMASSKPVQNISSN